jgi:hypothetical protein
MKERQLCNKGLFVADVRAQLRGGEMKIDLRPLLLAPAAGAGNPNQEQRVPPFY